jgi:hypothetical protein
VNTKHKTSELSGSLLDMAVAMAEGYPARIERGACYATITQMDAICGNWTPFLPSTDWAQGGPIIERHRITINCFNRDREHTSCTYWEAYSLEAGPIQAVWPLLAAMRCYVISKIGEDIKLPNIPQ